MRHTSTRLINSVHNNIICWALLVVVVLVFSPRSSQWIAAEQQQQQQRNDEDDVDDGRLRGGDGRAEHRLKDNPECSVRSSVAAAALALVVVGLFSLNIIFIFATPRLAFLIGGAAAASAATAPLCGWLLMRMTTSTVWCFSGPE